MTANERAAYEQYLTLMKKLNPDAGREAADIGMKVMAIDKLLGGTCKDVQDLMVCYNDSDVSQLNLFRQRGGTTYGNVFLSSEPIDVLKSSVIAHEKEHARQWQSLGNAMLYEYPKEEAKALIRQRQVGTYQSACFNIFERGAGLAAGGYAC